MGKTAVLLTSVHKDFITKKANVLSKRQQEMLEKYGEWPTAGLESMPHLGICFDRESLGSVVV